MEDLRVTTLTGRETTLPAAAVEEFKKSLRGQLVAPGDDSYEEACQVWNANIDRQPGLIARPARGGTIPVPGRFARLALLGLALLGLVAACSSGDFDGDGVAGNRPAARVETPTGTWVGRLDDSDAFVAIVVGGDQVVAYVCEDGKIASWFFGTAAGGSRFQLANAAGERLDVTLGDDARGTFSDGGTLRAFRAEATDAEVLFRADTLTGGEPVSGGWIRLGDATRGTITTLSGLQAAPTLSTTVQFESSLLGVLFLSPAPMTPDTLALPTPNTTKFVWAAVGDSFASGEGNPELDIADRTDVENFSGLRWGNNASITVPISGVTLAADVTTCHRSDEAGAPKAHRQLQSLYPGVQFALGFVACSGAETRHLYRDTYTGPHTTTASLLGNSRVTQPPQLDRIDTFKSTQGRLDALYMSVGGNDLGFGNIIAECISPIGPSNCADFWDPEITRRQGVLATSYNQLEARITQLFGNELPVLISLAPNPLHDGTDVCFGPDYDKHGEVGTGGLDDIFQDNLTVDEARFAFGISGRINSSSVSAAIRNGWAIVSSHVVPSEGHGLCTDVPFFNLNSAAVRGQGRDAADTLGFRFSTGVLHPNNAGFQRYGEAIASSLRPFIDDVVRSGLAAPRNVRIAAATSGGALTLRWNDRATAENAYEIEVFPNRSEDAADLVFPPGVTGLSGGGYLQRVNGIGVQQLVHEVSGPGQFKYRVRACHTAISELPRCGPFSAQIIGTNVAPAQPTGVTAGRFDVVAGLSHFIGTTVSWNTQVDSIEYVVRIENADGSGMPTEVRTTTTSHTVMGLVLLRFKVAACNRVGCSLFRAQSG